MTIWQFNLRSGLDSDEDDEVDSEKPAQTPSEGPACDPQQHDTNDNPASHHTLPNTTNEDSTSKELQELFGTAEEEKVCYKPNPWRIAKMNANARATSERLGVRKPTFKSPWPTNPTKQGGQCQLIIPGFTRPGPFASKPLTLERSKASGPSAGLRRTRVPSRSLRDSISAALRRGPDTALAVDDSTADNHNATTIPKNPIPPDSDIPEKDVSLASPDAGTYRFDDRSPQIPTPYSKDGAYIPEHETIIAQNSPTGLPQAQSAAPYPPASDSDGFESHTPALTRGHPSSDGLVSPIEGNYPLADLQDTLSGAGLRHGYEGPPHNFVTLPSPIMDPPSPELNPQHLLGAPAIPYPQGGLEPSYGDDYDSGYVRGASPAALELSPALQPRIQYAAKPLPQTNYTDMSRVDEYSPDANLREASPVFAYAAPSPIPERSQPSPSRTSTPAHKHNRVRELDPNDANIIPAIRREPITPLQPTRKYTTKSSPWLDPDEEPVWSTLPSRSKKTKQVKTPVTTSRFRLPGAFLGSSSPLGEQESKRLYKPPPRKRSMEQNEDRGKWKVTRIG